MSEYKREDNKLWLAGPSSYVFSLNGTKFAVDLQIRRESDLEALRDSLDSDLSDISFVLITHQHGDHMCVPLINALKDADIKWFIPEGTRADYMERSGLSEDKIVRTKPGGKYNVNGIEINAFFTPHAVGEQPFLQCGYRISDGKKNVIIPGDIRDYDYCDYPKSSNIDLCVSHLWAGKDSMTPDKYMPMLEKFCKTSASFGAKRYFLCHLYEIGREESSLWRYVHAGIAMDMLYSLRPESIVEIPRLGESYNI
ncbi:MAG: MBL fold metallo-hydrolase [Clostridia bacterium]|nr:MBL fold metallo-hydrolase [Clostridia bacterium]